MSDKEKVQQILTKYTISELVEYHIDAVDRINEAIEYIHNNQLVFELSSKEEIQKWFDEFYKDLLYMLRGEDNE